VSVNFDYVVNEYISAKEVRLVIGEDATVTLTRDALSQARQLGMDLVVINNSVPPVARIMNFSKFRYDQSKREKEQAKKSRSSQIDIKEIQLRPVTDTRDVEIKAKKAQSFLSDGDKVKVVVKFRGREMNHPDVGRTILETFLRQLPDHKLEKPITMNGRDMVMIVAPIKNTQSQPSHT
jgi:translation initiation factor IF-3